MKKITFGFILALLSVPGVLFAGTMTLTTTYPSPNGNYKNLTVQNLSAYNASGNGNVNVGIGTVTPSSELEIDAGTLTATTDLIRLSSTGGGESGEKRVAFYGNSAGTDPQAYIGSKLQGQQGSYGGYLSFGTTPAVSGASLTEAMRIDPNGNVGIGTMVPGASFQIFGISNTPSLSTSAGKGIAAFDTNSSVELAMGGYSQGSPYGFWLQTKDNQNGGGTGGAYPLIINPLGGSVGIGTATPYNTLSVAGGAAIGSAAYAGFAGPSNGLIVAGNVGIGIGTPQAKLEVDGGNLIVNPGTAVAQNYRDIEIGGFNGWAPGESHSINFDYGPTSAPTIVSSIESLYDAGGHANLNFRNDINSTNPALTIQGTSVGIGAIAPQASLDILGGNSNVPDLTVRSTTTRLDFYAYNNGNNYIESGTAAGLAAPLNFTGSGNTTGTFLFNGNVGINQTNPQYALDVTGDINVTGSATVNGFFYPSDERLKKNIHPIEHALDKVERLNGVTFTWRKDGKKDLGVIAQNVEKVIPEIVGRRNDGMRTVEYGNMVGLLIEAIKEQQKEIEDLKQKVAKLDHSSP